jgi:hypothetical protein
VEVSDAAILARLEARSTTDPATGCKIWNGARVKNYGAINVGRKLRRTHRVAWEAVNGPVPDGLELDHLCHTRSDCDRGAECPHRPCWNPEHLEPVTHTANVLRGTSPSARYAVATHCVAGHALAGDNLYITPSTGARQCRTCRAAHKAAWRKANRNAINAANRARRAAARAGRN